MTNAQVSGTAADTLSTIVRSHSTRMVGSSETELGLYMNSDSVGEMTRITSHNPI